MLVGSCRSANRDAGAQERQARRHSRSTQDALLAPNSGERELTQHAARAFAHAVGGLGAADGGGFALHERADRGAGAEDGCAYVGVP